MTEEHNEQEDTAPLFTISEPSQEIEIPKQIGPYKIEGLLQKGGMSVLYIGAENDEGSLTTVKVLLPKFLLNRDVVDRFLREAEIIALADHPNVVKMYGHGEWEGGLYIAMEYITGMSLRQYILHTPISLRKALEFVLNIAYALCHLHTHGIIHRDLKPENIIVTESGQIKVIDFGIAHLLSDKDGSDSMLPPRTIGTPIYMSPEQRLNPEFVSYPSDIYSLGIVAYELILGKLSHGQLHLALMPKGIQKILNKALQPNLENRYIDVVDFISDLSSYLHSSAPEKEKLISDQISEIYESFISAQRILNATKGFNWSLLKIGIAMHQEHGLRDSYSDFIDDVEGGSYIIFGKSSLSSVEGIVQAATVRGMVHALIDDYKGLDKSVTCFNQAICNDSLLSSFGLCILSIDPKLEHLYFCSCGFGQLWVLPSGGLAPYQIASNNELLGVRSDNVFRQSSKAWKSGDELLLIGMPHLTDFDEQKKLEKAIVHAAKERHHFLSPQKKVDAIMRKIKATPGLVLSRTLFLSIITK